MKYSLKIVIDANRESGIFRNEFVRNDSCKNWGNSQKFIWRDPVPPAYAPASVFSFLCVLVATPPGDFF